MNDPDPKLLHARFDQREGTPDSQLRPDPVVRHMVCDCVNPFRIHKSEETQELLRTAEHGGFQEPQLHTEVQDRNCDAWSALEEYIERIAKTGSDEFNPRRGIGSELWQQVVTLPPSIAKLQSVKYFALYGSPLVRIPPEIGELSSLEEFDPYTSYCLHWFPYEITRCPKLVRSRVSTRALYGNYKFRPPFPRLPANLPDRTPNSCSICGGHFGNRVPVQVWISLRVATDVLPLLVHACSPECVNRLPKPAERYVQQPHQGGLELEQPPSRF